MWLHGYNLKLLRSKLNNFETTFWRTSRIPLAIPCKKTRRIFWHKLALDIVSGARFSMLDWVRVTGLSCTKGVWYIYDRDTGQLIRCVEGPCGLPLLLHVNYSV